MADNAPLTGRELPGIVSPIPGSRSRTLAERLTRVESRNITSVQPDPPIFWTEARDAVVRDADGNTFIDLTAGFGVAFAGHANPDVAAAITSQAGRLSVALGDVYPADIKATLLDWIADIAPGDLAVTILASAGAEAVEAALKTAVLRTDRSGVLAFEGGYHGLTYGALATTWRDHFRANFTTQLFRGVRFAPYPSASIAGSEASTLDAVRAHINSAENSAAPIGAILVEPIQGRGGIVVPTPGFLRALRDLCDGEHIVFILDEIYTGIGRTGAWFACQHSNVVPDVMVLGKALGGGLPISAAVGTASVMQAWPPSTGEAIHTSTFLGNPIACAAACAQLAVIQEQSLVRRAAQLGGRIRTRTDDWVSRLPVVSAARGVGLLQGIVIRSSAGKNAAGLALEIANRALQSGILILTEGDYGDVLAITPPAVITEEQLDYALDMLENVISQIA